MQRLGGCSTVELLVALGDGPPLGRPLQPVTGGMHDDLAVDDDEDVVVVGAQQHLALVGQLAQGVGDPLVGADRLELRLDGKHAQVGQKSRWGSATINVRVMIRTR